MIKLTPFAKKVYKAVLAIPLGQVRSYQWVACHAGNPKAARAVGRILNRNPFIVLIPCHRVVHSDHRIGGYAGGAKKKSQLLALERRIKICLQIRE